MPYDSLSLQRADGFAEMVFAKTKSRTGLVHLYQHDPCRVLFPQAEPGNPPTAVVLTTSGGVTGGDRLRLSIAARDGAAATVISQAAEKVYRSLGPDCRMDISAEVGKAWLEWLPQETILFDGARLRRNTCVDVAAGGQFLACEMLVFGRIARGERYATGLLHDGWRVLRGGHLTWVDVLRLDGAIADTIDHASAFGGATSVASAIYVADDGPSHLEAARSLAARAEGRAGVTCVNGVLLARFLGEAETVRRDLTSYLAECRHLFGGLPPRLPRVWYN